MLSETRLRQQSAGAASLCIYTCGRHNAAVAGSTWKHETADWVEILTELATPLSVVRQ